MALASTAATTGVLHNTLTDDIIDAVEDGEAPDAPLAAACD